MRIDIWSDIVCPWCAIGKAHLDLALAWFEQVREVRVVWRSFELDPGAPAAGDGDYSALMATKYGASPAGGKAMVARMSAAAEHAGVLARFDLVRPANTFDAHRVLHLANERGLQDVLVARLTRAYLAEGELLSDHPTLQRLGEEVGLPATDLADALNGDAYAQQVRADQAEAGRREVIAVPTFLVNRRYVIPGAQSPVSILATLNRAWSAQLAGRESESELQ